MRSLLRPWNTIDGSGHHATRAAGMQPPENATVLILLPRQARRQGRGIRLLLVHKIVTP